MRSTITLLALLSLLAVARLEAEEVATTCTRDTCGTAEEIADFYQHEQKRD
jgi:hypothetical protein